MRQVGWPPLNLMERKRLIDFAIAEYDWLALEEAEGAFIASLRERWPRLRFNSFTMNGADDVLKYGKISWSSPDARFITMGRQGYTAKVEEAMKNACVDPDAGNFILGPELPDDISSTAVRKALVENDLGTLSSMLHPDVAKWCRENWLPG